MSAKDPILLATTIFVRQEDGTRKQYHQGEAVPGLDAEQVERLTKCGALGTSADLEPEAVEHEDVIERNGAGVPVPDADDGVERPDEDANKPELVTWIYENVAKEDGSDYTKTELNKMSPDDLRAIIESVE